MDKNEKTVLKTSRNEFGKRYTAFQIFLNGLHGNKNLNSELFIMKKKNNIQKKELNILKLFLVSKKKKSGFYFVQAL